MYMYLKVKEVNSFLDIKDLNEPILVKSGCSDMTAVKKWNLNYLLETIGDQEFKFEKYKKKKDMQIMKVVGCSMRLSFSEFVKKSYEGKSPHFYFADKDLDEYKDKLPDSILEDISGKVDILFGEPEQNNIFLGVNCMTGCHIHILEDFILNQIVGDKIVYLFDYNENYVTPRNILTNSFNFCKENFFKMDHSGKKIYKVVVKPGDSLCIPPWWWHATKGVDFSCSITKIIYRKNNDFLKSSYYLTVLAWRVRLAKIVILIYYSLINLFEYLLSGNLV